MPSISLKAHFDGTAIQLDEPYELPRDAQLLVTVLAPIEADTGLVGWSELATDGLARGFGDEEPDYTSADLQP